MKTGLLMQVQHRGPMRKPSKCRSCNINYDLTLKVGRHQLVDAGMVCPLCNFAGKSVYHGQHEDLSGDALECKSCHNYIKYGDGAGTTWKDEIYLNDDWLLIRDYEDSKSYFSIKEKLVITFPHIVQFNTLEELRNKLETLVIFL